MSHIVRHEASIAVHQFLQRGIRVEPLLREHWSGKCRPQGTSSEHSCQRSRHCCLQESSPGGVSLRRLPLFLWDRCGVRIADVVGVTVLYSCRCHFAPFLYNFVFLSLVVFFSRTCRELSAMWPYSRKASSWRMTCQLA